VNRRTGRLHQQNLALSLALILSGVSMLVLGLPLILLGNETLFLRVNEHCLPNFSRAAFYFSLLGESWAMGFLLLLSFGMPLRNTLFLCMCWLSAALHSWLFKLWLCKGWPRPYQYFLEKQLSIQLADGVTPHHWNSFPSGHTITAFSMLLMIPLLFPRLKPAYILPFWVLAFGCGLSRIVLVQHWPADVLGGIILGCSATMLSFQLMKRTFPESGWLDISAIKLLYRNRK
jgi:membrane-associated phospholipid phosphatase